MTNVFGGKSTVSIFILGEHVSKMWLYLTNNHCGYYTSTVVHLF